MDQLGDDWVWDGLIYRLHNSHCLVTGVAEATQPNVSHPRGEQHKLVLTAHGMGSKREKRHKQGHLKHMLRTGTLSLSPHSTGEGKLQGKSRFEGWGNRDRLLRKAGVKSHCNVCGFGKVRRIRNILTTDYT